MAVPMSQEEKQVLAVIKLRDAEDGGFEFWMKKLVEVEEGAKEDPGFRLLWVRGSLVSAELLDALREAVVKQLERDGGRREHEH